MYEFIIIILIKKYVSSEFIYKYDEKGDLIIKEKLPYI